MRSGIWVPVFFFSGHNASIIRVGVFHHDDGGSIFHLPGFTLSQSIRSHSMNPHHCEISELESDLLLSQCRKFSETPFFFNDNQARNVCPNNNNKVGTHSSNPLSCYLTLFVLLLATILGVLDIPLSQQISAAVTSRNSPTLYLLHICIFIYFKILV